MPQQERHGVVKGDQGGVEHEFILGGRANDVEGEVEGLLVEDQVLVEEEDVTCGGGLGQFSVNRDGPL